MVNPYLTVGDVSGLVEFLQRAFDGAIVRQIKQPDGRIEHAEVQVGNSLLMIGPSHVESLARSHDEHRPGTFYVFAADVDAVYRRAMICGASAWQAPADTFYGDRVAAVTDTNGNVWWIATRARPLGAEELQKRADEHWHKRGSVPVDQIAKAQRGSRADGLGMSEQIGTPPVGYKSVNSYLTVVDVPRLIEFLKGTFDAVVTAQIKQPDGKIEHAEVRVGDSLVMVGPPLVDSIIRTQDRHRPGTFYVFVADVDATCRRAAALGAEIWEPPAEAFYGDRIAGFTDANGNRWWIATRKEALGPAELQERAEQHWHVRTQAVGKSVTKSVLLEFLRSHRHAVEASQGEEGFPEAALVQFVVNDRFELFFDSFDSTRKVANLRRDPRVAFVIGGHTVGDARTVQYEGMVDVPDGAELEYLKSSYFSVHPDGPRRSRQRGISYFRVRPRWIRYTNFNAAPAQIVVFEGAALADDQAQGGAAASPYAEPQTLWRPHVEQERYFNSFLSSTRATL